MSDKEINTFNTEINSLMGMLDKHKKANQEQIENYKKQHTALIKDSEALKKFYENAVYLDTWLLHSEVIPYCMAVEPSQWFNIKSGYQQWTDKLSPLINAGAGDTLKIINPEAKERQWRVKPKEFVQWLHKKGLRPRKELEEVLGIKFKDENSRKENYNDHANAEHQAQKRQKILEAALAVLAHYPDKCMEKGKVSGTAIGRMIEQNSPFWFDDEVPVSERGVTDLINKALNTIPD